MNVIAALIKRLNGRDNILVANKELGNLYDDSFCTVDVRLVGVPLR